MFKVSEWLKMGILALWINLAPPVVCFAEGPLGASFNGGVNDRGIWGVNEWTWAKIFERGTREMPPANHIYVGVTEFGYAPTPWPTASVPADYGVAASAISGLTSAIGVSYTPAGAYLDNTSLGTREGMPFLRWLIKEKLIWDADGDGDHDQADYTRIMTDLDSDGTPNASDPDTATFLDVIEPEKDMGKEDNMHNIPLGLLMLKYGLLDDLNGDGAINVKDLYLAGDYDLDGIANEIDLDDDGDGELDFVEKRIAETSWTTSLQQLSDPPPNFDKNTFLDRDSDTLPDFLDKDGDGAPNWVEQLAGKNANDPLSVPNGPPWFVDQSSGSMWTDTDGDGAYDWFEIGTSTNPNDSEDFNDGNFDSAWDWIGVDFPETFPLTPTVPDPPDPPMPGDTPPNPPNPVQVVTPAPVPGSPTVTPVGGSGGGQTGGGTSTSPTNGNVSNVQPTPGNPMTGQPGSGQNSGGFYTGGGTPAPSEASGGIITEVLVPRGESTNYKGATGGSWQSLASPDREGEAGDALDKSIEGTNKMQPDISSINNETASYSLTFEIPWVPWNTGAVKVVTIPLIPDVTKPAGAQVEWLRVWIRAFAAAVLSYRFMCGIWLAIRQL